MRLFSILPLLLVLWVPAAAGTPEIYSEKQLVEDEERYTQKFEFLLEKGLRDFMTAAELHALQGVVIRHPLRGSDPLSIKSAVVEGTPIVRAPVESLKFIEDLTIAYAWRYKNNYSFEPMDEYLAMLKYRPAEEFPDGRLPDPLTALGVPPGIWKRDQQIDELSLRFRNTAWAFILAHELGHLRLGHAQTGASPAELQRQEEEADEFAADLLGRSDTIPMGMILWFQATAAYMPNRSDFPSDAAYFDWVQTAASHPVNGRRLQNLASIMRNQAVAQGDRNRAETLEFIAARLVAIGETIENPDMQRLIKRCASSRQPEDLKRLDDRPCF